MEESRRAKPATSPNYKNIQTGPAERREQVILVWFDSKLHGARDVIK